MRSIQKYIALSLVALLPFSVLAQEDEETSQLQAPESTDNAITDVGIEVVKADTLAELLEQVKERRDLENAMHIQREREFAEKRDQQQSLLNDARAEQGRQEQRSEDLDTQYEANEIRIGELGELLDDRLGQLRELFGVLQQVAGDTRGVFDGSLISAEMPGRGEFLGDLASKMGTATELATIEEMEQMWYLLIENMIETGEISRFQGQVSMLSGEQNSTDVLRIGPFNLISEDGYVNYDLALGHMTELARQPSAEFTNTAEDLFEGDAGEIIGFAIDPTRGSLLSLEIQRATLGEMVGSPYRGIANGSCYLPFCDGQGGYVGSIIILVGLLGVILAVQRLIMLLIVGRKVEAQKRNPGEYDEKNPLGRIISIYHANREVDSETLQLKMGEAVLKETPAITRNINIVQVISVVAPLMGLLGTVIGMIQTFQAITLFGTGDPKIMAGGISTALMTTVLGLCVAIPTVLLHALVAQRSRSVIHVLDEQSEGIIAQHAEEVHSPIRSRHEAEEQE